MIRDLINDLAPGLYQFWTTEEQDLPFPSHDGLTYTLQELDTVGLYKTTRPLATIDDSLGEVPGTCSYIAKCFCTAVIIGFSNTDQLIIAGHIAIN